MGNARCQMRTAMVCAAVLCLPTPAQASGHLPLPPATETFKSHSACLAALEDDQGYTLSTFDPPASTK